MVSTGLDSAEVESEPTAGESFRFISIQAPGDAKDQTTRRLARSHAVKKALEKKRRLQQKSSENFRITTLKGKPRRPVINRACTETLTASLFSLSASAFDPFQTLPVNSSRLQTLLGDYKARQAPEPVFSVSEGVAFQNFHTVFRTGLVDPALLNAVMLSFVFAVTEGSINRECLWYQGQAISYIREKMDSLDEATTESTIGAILLLAGVEARLGMASQVQLHLGAVQQLLEVCRAEGIYLTSGIKRAIFWQDLNSSILAGSRRIVDHTTFVELHWKRDPFYLKSYRLSSGFQTLSHLLTEEFIEVLEDIHSLQCIRDFPRFTRGDVLMMAHVNNHAASIQSRLLGLTNLSPFLECCRLAVHVCSIMLCCKVWCGLVFPSHISSQLLVELQKAKDDPLWDRHPNLLLWILYIGGTFVPTGPVRSEYIVMLHANNATRFRGLCRSWPAVLDILRQFTWSEQAYMPRARRFWEETLS